MNCLPDCPTNLIRMTKRYYLFKFDSRTFFTLLIVLIIGCVPTEEEPDVEPSGLLVLSVERSDDIETIKNGRILAETPVEDYNVSIYNASDELIVSYDDYSEVPATVQLPVGSYYAIAHSENLVDAAFENPYYYGTSEVFNVTESEISVVDIACQLANAMITFQYTSETVSTFDSYETEASIEATSLVFIQGEGRPGFFDIKTINFTSTLQVGGTTKQVTGTFLPEPKTHYIVTIQASADDPIPSITITIDESTETEHLFFDESGETDIVDGSGNVYTAITIGTQDWLLENIRTTKLNDGTDIPEVTGSTEWSSLVTPGFSWYGNNASNGQEYGGLYNWYVVNTGKVCPKGWHVPNEEEWSTLSDFVGYGFAGKLKEAGNNHWQSPNVGATNESGFTALPGGDRTNEGEFRSIGQFGRWYNYNVEPNSNTYLGLSYLGEYTSRGGVPKNYGYSIRCIRNE